MLRGRGLVASENLRCHDADVGDVRRVTHTDDLSDGAEVEVLVTLHEHNLLLPGFEDLRQLRLNVGLCERVVVDLVDRKSAASDNLNDDRTVVGLVLRLVLRRLWHQRLKTLGGRGHDDHEEDEKHKQHIYQRCDVDLRDFCIGTASSTHSHTVTPFGPYWSLCPS